MVLDALDHHELFFESHIDFGVARRHCNLKHYDSSTSFLHIDQLKTIDTSFENEGKDEKPLGCDLGRLRSGNEPLGPEGLFVDMKGPEVEAWRPHENCHHADGGEDACWHSGRLLNEDCGSRCYHIRWADGSADSTYTCPAWIRWPKAPPAPEDPTDANKGKDKKGKEEGEDKQQEKKGKEDEGEGNFVCDGSAAALKGQSLPGLPSQMQICPLSVAGTLTAAQRNRFLMAVTSPCTGPFGSRHICLTDPKAKLPSPPDQPFSGTPELYMYFDARHGRWFRCNAGMVCQEADILKVQSPGDEGCPKGEMDEEGKVKENIPCQGKGKGGGDKKKSQEGGGDEKKAEEGSDGGSSAEGSLCFQHIRQSHKPANKSEEGHDEAKGKKDKKGEKGEQATDQPGTQNEYVTTKSMTSECIPAAHVFIVPSGDNDPDFRIGGQGPICKDYGTNIANVNWSTGEPDALTPANANFISQILGKIDFL